MSCTCPILYYYALLAVINSQIACRLKNGISTGYLWAPLCVPMYDDTSAHLIPDLTLTQYYVSFLLSPLSDTYLSP